MSKCACRGHALVLGEDYILDQKGKWHSLSVCSTHLALEARVRR